MEDGKCLVQLYGAEGLYFLGRSGEYTDNIQDALIFKDELDAHIYIDKRGLRKLSKVRKIVSQKSTEPNKDND